MVNFMLIEQKTYRVLCAFLNGGKFNRFEATEYLHDYCLNATVANIQTRFKLSISREYEIILGYQGRKVRCCRYWIAPEEVRRYKESSVASLLSECSLVEKGAERDK